MSTDETSSSQWKAYSTERTQENELTLSIIIPVKGNLETICETVRSLLEQRLDGDYEVIVVVDSTDPTYQLLATIFDDPRLLLVHPSETFPLRGRDANWRRGVGLACARGRFLALTDGDIFFKQDWAQTGVDLLRKGQNECVAGEMASHSDDTFWGDYVDHNPLGTKTPRYQEPFLLDLHNFGRGGRKPGVTANMFFTRELVKHVGVPRPDFLYTYEDYAFFYDIVNAGYTVLCTPELTGFHHHRSRIRELVWEYWTSGQGCADFIFSYPEAHFGRKRLLQLGGVVTLSMASTAGLIMSTAATTLTLATTLLVLGLWSMAKVRRAHALAFPPATLLLGLAFSFGLMSGLWRGGPPRLSLRRDRNPDVVSDVSDRQAS